ncbi:TPA: ATP-binding protein [Vibrio diabolicus]
MSFRVVSFSYESDSFKTPLVELARNDSAQDENYFTVVIGNNGAGKSRFVSNLVDAFRDVNEKKRRNLTEYRLDYVRDDYLYEIERKFVESKNGRRYKTELSVNREPCSPNRVITITTSLSDKFPRDGYHQLRPTELQENGDDYYLYLGPRAINGMSTRILMDKAISALVANVGYQEHSESYRYIFDYLNYEPVVKLSYEVRIPRNLSGDLIDIAGKDFKEFLHDYSSSRGGFRKDSIERSLNRYPDSHWDELAKVYQYIKISSHKDRYKNKFSLLVNFSERNEVRDTQGSDELNLDLYLKLEELRKYDLVRGPTTKLYKKDGGEFDFNDASSGEASILSTLIALTPNVENDSLIVIDEPEISLHPSWQYRYIELIDKILSRKRGCHVVIATHSHFVISDLPMGRSSVVHFKANNGKSVECDYIESETHGLSAEDILLNIFDMPSTRNYYLSNEVSEALEIVAEGGRDSERFKFLVSKFKRYILHVKDVDPLKDVLVTLISLER